MRIAIKNAFYDLKTFVSLLKLCEIKYDSNDDDAGKLDEMTIHFLGSGIKAYCGVA